MSIFSGASGKIIGPKGAKIQEIKTTSGVKDIKMPAKNEDGTRPKARDLVELTIIGKPSAIEKARELIQEVVDEWVRLLLPYWIQRRMQSNLLTLIGQCSSSFS
jgi:hypothetical protein